MKEQTAVDYLLEYCSRENWSIPVEVKQYAKAMEKEQMIEFAYDYVKSGSIYCLWNVDSAPELDIDKNPRQYYNIKYGGNK
jgi:hypothetical protein